MVNRYNILINYKSRSLQNDTWVRENITSEATVKI
jgi:hypothetical protein